MKHSYSALGALTLTVLLFATAQAAGESLMTFHTERPIRLEAAELRADYTRGLYEATGSAQMRQDGLALNADRIWYDKNTDQAGATGQVHLAESGGTLEGETLTINLQDETARLTRARAKLAGQGLQLSGTEIAKLGENSYQITEGTFTACLDMPPSWKFGADEVKVDVGGYARAKNVIFYLKDIPVLYLPYFLYPVKTERQSGFLMPDAGYSQLRGVELSLVYYQVFGRNMDATFYLDIYSRAGIGKGMEYRYVFGDDNVGTARVYHVNGFDERRNVYSGRWQHAGTLPGGVRLRNDLEYVSHREYLTDFATDAKDYNRDLIESYMYVSRNWGKTDFAIQGEYFKDFSPEATDDPVIRLPEVQLAVTPRRIAESPLYLRLDLGGNNLQQSSDTVGQTLTARSAARLVMRPVDGLSVEGEGGFRGILFKHDQTTEHFDFFDLAAQTTATFVRAFGSADGADTFLRHAMIPQIGFLQIQDRGQEQLPQALQEELLLPAKRLTFALANRLTARSKEGDGYQTSRDWLWLKLSSAYNLDRTPDNSEDFEALRTELRLQPSHYLSVTADSRYDLFANHRRWKSASADIELSDTRQDELGLTYYFSNDSDEEYLAGRAGIPLTDQLRTTYQGRFSIDGSRSLEHLVNLEYQGQCWSVTLTFRDRPGEQEYLINFNLAGLGKGSSYFDAAGYQATHSDDLRRPM